MSERDLDTVIRQLDKAVADIKYASELADNLLRNHVVAMEIHQLKYEIYDYRIELDSGYRTTHFSKKNRR